MLVGASPAVLQTRHVPAKRQHVARGCAPLARRPPASQCHSQSIGSEVHDTDLLTLQELEEIAKARGFNLAVRELGPFFRVVCREGGPEGRLLGVTTGFTVPLTDILHCETLQIFTKGVKGEEGEKLRGGPLGLGPLIGLTTFAFGASKGCRTAEILAINDDDDQHRRLVLYYRYFGFKPVKVVEGGLQDLPDMLVWGGVGTRMDVDIRAALKRWAPAVRRGGVDGTWMHRRGKVQGADGQGGQAA